MHMPVRTPWGDFPDVYIIETDEQSFRRHPGYDAAKSGDLDAALALVRAYVTPDHVHRIGAFGSGEPLTIVAVHAVEGNSVNVIPEVYAAFLAEMLCWDTETGIVQQNRVGHTKSSGFHRLATPALFDGPVTRGQRYLLVDDFIGQGGTLVNLKGYVEANGGFAVSATVMAGKAHSARLKLQQSTLLELRGRHHELEGEWQSVFRYGFDFLTESEARYLARTPDAVRIRADVLAPAKTGVAGLYSAEVEG